MICARHAETGRGAQRGADVARDVGLKQSDFHARCIGRKPAQIEGLEGSARDAIAKGKLPVGKPRMCRYQARNSRRGRRGARCRARANGVAFDPG